MAFKSGDIVKLKSGSSLMTVESDDSARGRWICVWHDKNEENVANILKRP